MKHINIIAVIALLGAPPAYSAGRHTVVPQDTMWDLALRYYNNNYLWRKIAEANPAPSVKDPHWIYPGQVLIIPDIEGPEPAPMDAGAMQPPPQVVEAEPAPEPPTIPPDIEDSLSTELPAGQPSSAISMRRLQAEEGWKADGEITGRGEDDAMAAAGDMIDVKIYDQNAAPGERFEVYRRAAPTEADEDQDGEYLVYVGRIEVRSPVKGKIYRSLILQSTDAMTGGDLVKRGR